MHKVELLSNWKMKVVGESDSVPATVPGSVYGDLLEAGKLENPFWKDNEDKALKLMDNDFVYSLCFDCDEEIFDSDEVILHFDGLDTIADVSLNGELLGHVENMHRVWEFAVKDILEVKGNKLEVYFYSPTKYIKDAFEKAPTLGTEDAMNGFVHIRKAHCMFGWDWGAHLPDAGIWREVSLLGINIARIDTVEVLQYHEEGKVRLEINPELEIFTDSKCCCKSGGNCGCKTEGEDSGCGCKTEGKSSNCSCKADGEDRKDACDDEKNIFTSVTVLDPNGEKVASLDKVSIDDYVEDIIIENPMLWWPNGYGEQYLYTVLVDLRSEDGKLLDSWSRKIGLRTITMDRTKDKWGERFATCVNGVNIFAMGADYIPEDHLLGRVTRETTRALLEKAIFANFNSIRVWGGGYYPDDFFFDLCDEMGILVWQDFMFACAVYDLTPEFEENITAEFIDNIKRIRHHASLALMCGNNEMEQFVLERNWVSKDSEVRDYIIMYERIIPSIMKEYAPQIFYWPASPSSGGCFDNPGDENRGDVHYWDVWHGNKPFSEYRKFYFRYLSEFGFQAFPSKKTVETFTDDENDMNIFSYIMERHQRNGSANGKIMNYMQQTYKYPSSFERVIYASQLLQADAIKYGVEHFRRNRNDDRCMGAVYWQFNDCWPVASWSSVDYCGRLKALHYYAKRFFAPIMISCEEEGMLGSGQELVRLPFEFPKSIRLNVANESMKDEIITVKWQIRDASANILREETEVINVPKLSTVWLDKVELFDIDIWSQYVSYQAFKEEEEVSAGTVIFSYPKYFRYENPDIKVSIDGKKITVASDKYAKSVCILNENEDLILSDNYFDLNGDSRTVEVICGNIDNLRVMSVYDIK